MPQSPFPRNVFVYDDNVPEGASPILIAGFSHRRRRVLFLPRILLPASSAIQIQTHPREQHRPPTRRYNRPCRLILVISAGHSSAHSNY